MGKFLRPAGGGCRGRGDFRCTPAFCFRTSRALRHSRESRNPVPWFINAKRRQYRQEQEFEISIYSDPFDFLFKLFTEETHAKITRAFIFLLNAPFLVFWVSYVWVCGYLYLSRINGFGVN